MHTRRKSKKIHAGKLIIGGNAPVSVQSMTTVKTSRVPLVLKQINKLQEVGCELIRVSILDSHDAIAVRDIKKEISIPLCADIHFNFKLAINAIKNGADKIRINPGNIKDKNAIKRIIYAAKDKTIPIRIGVNSGSIDSSIKRNVSIGKRLAFSVLKSISYIESLKFKDIIISAKSHSVNDTIEAYEEIAERTDYPLHVGVTASGVGEYAIIKSSVALGRLLSEGIGDTIRVSLTDDPIHEISVAYNILQSLGLRKRSWEVISCPTCGRCEIDVISLSKKVELLLQKGKILLPKVPYKIAVMGCVVNGPGESKVADIGITGGKGFGFLFKKGKLIRKVSEKNLLRALINEIRIKK